MSTTLEPQIRELSQAFEASIDPVTVDEILGGIESATLAATRPRRPAWVTVVAVASLVLVPLIIIASLWLDEEPTDQVTTTTVPEVTTTTIEAAPGPTQPATVVAPSSASGPTPQEIVWEPIDGSEPTSSRNGGPYIAGVLGQTLIVVEPSFVWLNDVETKAGGRPGDDVAYLHTSADGVEWSRTSLPDVLADDMLTAAADGDTLWVFKHGFVSPDVREAPEMWFTHDGETWTQAQFTPALEARWDHIDHTEDTMFRRPIDREYRDPFFWGGYAVIDGGGRISPPQVNGSTVVFPTTEGLWVSSDGGETFEHLDDVFDLRSPLDTRVNSSSFWLRSVEDGFAALVYRQTYDGVELFTSSDGVEWISRGDPGIRLGGHSGDVTTYGNTLVMAESGQDGHVWAGTPGSTFRLVLDLDEWVGVQRGTSGFLAITETAYRTSADGFQWSTAQDVASHSWSRLPFHNFELEGGVWPIGDILVSTNLGVIGRLGDDAAIEATPEQPEAPAAPAVTDPPNLEWNLLETTERWDSRVAAFNGKFLRIDNALEYVCDFDPPQCEGRRFPDNIYQDVDGDSFGRILSSTDGVTWKLAAAPEFLQTETAFAWGGYTIGDEYWVHVFDGEAGISFWSTRDLKNWTRVVFDDASVREPWDLYGTWPGRAMSTGEVTLIPQYNRLWIRRTPDSAFVAVDNAIRLDDQQIGSGLTFVATEFGLRAFIDRPEQGSVALWGSKDGVNWMVRNADVGFRTETSEDYEWGPALVTPEGRIAVLWDGQAWIETAPNSGKFERAAGGGGVAPYMGGYSFSDILLLPGESQTYGSVDGRSWHAVMPRKVLAVASDEGGFVSFSNLVEANGLVLEGRGLFTVRLID